MNKAINSTRERIETALNSTKILGRVIFYIVSTVVAAMLVYTTLVNRVEANSKSIVNLKFDESELKGRVRIVEESVIRQSEQNVWIRASLERIEKGK